MSFATEKRILTDEEFMSLAEGNSHYELINGEVIKKRVEMTAIPYQLPG